VEILKREWKVMSEEEKLKIINPFLDNLKNILLHESVHDCLVEFERDELPEIINGLGTRFFIPVLAEETIRIRLSRVRSR
jgi:hypothetical protein